MNNKPVAWMYKNDSDTFFSAIDHSVNNKWIPLYTHPVKDKPHPKCDEACMYLCQMRELTDEEIEELWYDPRFIGDPVAFGKAVLRATKNIPLQTDEEICKKCDALTERAIIRKASEK